jgi:putative tryptophan/tyrosine transport system substrate-binding protein
VRRRNFLNIICLSAVSWPLGVRAERSNSPPLIGVLLATHADDALSKAFTRDFSKALHKSEPATSQQTKIEYRFGGGDTDLSSVLARELISLRPDVIVAVSNTSMAALHHASTTIPVVFANVSDPVGVGYVNSLSRPGGSVTGLTPFEPSLGSKWLSYLKELAPGIKDVGVMFNPEPGNNSRAFLQSIKGTAGTFSIERVVTPQADSSDIERVIIDLGKTPNGGLVFLPDALTYARRDRMVELIAQQRIPAIYPWRDFVVAGGLISYGPGVGYNDELCEQAAGYVNRILNGEKPAELPVQAPTKLAISLNVRTARTLGLEIPANLIALADEVIE